MLSEHVSPLVEVGDPDAPPGSRPWALHILAKLIALLQDNDSSAWMLKSYLDALKRHEGWRQLQDGRGHPFLTYEGFCCARPPFGLGYDPADLERIYRERRSIQARAQGLKGKLLDQGPPTKKERSSKGTARTFTTRGGNPDYRAARLARDHHDVFVRMEAGEFSNMAQAERAAGIDKKYPKVTPTPEGFARAARKYIPEQLAELVRLLTEVPE